MSLWKILVAGLVIHMIVFISVFDIYFSAIIIDGLPARSSPLPAPAKRLIFIVADGLRADKTFMLQRDGRSAAHYLRNIGKTQGTWGVSIAGIPTATRPGHVAMTAGFHEDPTSVAKDINAAAITFDTVFKETRYTWTWDTPKFLEQVAKDHPDRIFSKQFPGERKYLSGIDPKDMDSWVFNEVSTFLKNARDDTDLKEKMNKDKVLFFLHLGGIDHAGYIVRPNSERYLQHLAFLDDGIKDIIEQFEDFFDHDKKTTYIFTSDHGMTNYGAHGDGMPHEILCPLITWGAGIRKPIPENDLSRYNDTLSQDWSLTEWKRANIEQPSLAPLMAAAIGITYPRNAIYPIPDGFFDVSDEKLFEMFYANLKQLLDNYVAFERYTHKGPLAFQFRSYRPLSGVLITSLKTDIEAQKEAGNYAQALKLTKEKIELTVNGIQHYRLYSKVPLWLATFTSLVGWFCFCGLLLIQQMQHWEDIKVTTPIMSNTKHIIIQCTVGLIVFDLIFLYAQSTPVTQCIHFLMPIPILAACILKCHELGNIFPILKRQKELAPMGVASVMVSIGLAMVLSYHRIFISLLILAVQLSYVYFGRKDLKKGLFKQWVFTSVVLAILSGRPVGDRDIQYSLVLLGGVMATTAVFLFHMEMDGSAVKGRLCRNFGKRFAAYQVLKLALATCVLYYSSYLTQNDIRTPPSVQITSWLILFVSLLEPLYVNTDIQSRLVAISFGLAAPYILLCTRQEVLGYIFLIWNQYLFIELESNITKAQPILLPLTTNEATNRVPNSSVSNGKSVTKGNVKHHKHTKSNDYLMWQPSVSEWQSLDFAGAAESDSHCKKLLTTGDIRRALQFIIMAVASTLLEGLVISINSFDVQDVFCFITVSNPPKMGPLIIFKDIMSAFVIGCFFSATNVITFTSNRNVSLVLLMVTSLICTIQFTRVTNVGTWTAIGASVSQFLISACFCMFVSLYVGVTYVLTTFNISFVFSACFKLLARKLSKLQSFL